MSSTSNGNFASDGFVIVTLTVLCKQHHLLISSTLLACTKQAFKHTYVEGVVFFFAQAEPWCTGWSVKCRYIIGVCVSISPGSKRFSCNDFNTHRAIKSLRACGIRSAEISIARLHLVATRQVHPELKSMKPPTDVSKFALAFE